MINHDGIDVPTENDGDRRLESSLCWFAKINDPSMDAWEDPLQSGDDLLHLGLLLGLLLVSIGLNEFVVARLKFLVRLCLELAEQCYRSACVLDHW